MKLELYGDYNRHEIHDIFDPKSPFTTGAGTWGLHGIVRIPDQPGDFVLFVTLGKQEGDHVFDESINDQGILRWQSQPRQDLSSPAVRQLIEHDQHGNNVFLFLRTARLRGGVAPPFTFLGRLRYLEHDAERAHPAHIAWQLLTWPAPEEVLKRMQLDLVVETKPEKFTPLPPTSNNPVSALVDEPPPSNLAPIGEPTKSFQARKVRFKSSDQSSALGLKGELLVLARERKNLLEAGKKDLADQIVHTSIVQGDGAGYDIASFFADGRRKFIEVKTTTGAKSSDFFISPNELAFSASNPKNFELCRVFALDENSGMARSYSLWGDMNDSLSLMETQYRARPLAE